MELILVFLGVFLVAAISRNRDYRKPESKELLSVVTSASLWLVLGGLGFLITLSPHAMVNMSLQLVPLVMCAWITAYSKGPIKVISRVAWVCVLAFLIMGSFMK